MRVVDNLLQNKMQKENESLMKSDGKKEEPSRVNQLQDFIKYNCVELEISKDSHDLTPIIQNLIKLFDKLSGGYLECNRVALYSLKNSKGKIKLRGYWHHFRPYRVENLINIEETKQKVKLAIERIQSQILIADVLFQLLNKENDYLMISEDYKKNLTSKRNSGNQIIASLRVKAIASKENDIDLQILDKISQIEENFTKQGGDFKMQVSDLLNSIYSQDVEKALSETLQKESTYWNKTSNKTIISFMYSQKSKDQLDFSDIVDKQDLQMNSIKEDKLSYQLVSNDCNNIILRAYDPLLPSIYFEIEQNKGRVWQEYLEKSKLRQHLRVLAPTIVKENGITFRGEMIGREENGFIIKYFPNGSYYQGTCLQYKIFGYGELFINNVYNYKGEWKNTKKNGKGKLTHSNGAYYEGDFYENEYHGQGVRISSDGIKYEGQWNNSKPHGKGVQIWPNGTKYIGSFCRDKMHGYGTYLADDGNKCEGYFKKNSPTKYCKLTDKFGKVHNVSTWISFRTDQIFKSEDYIDNNKKFKWILRIGKYLIKS